MLMLLFFLHIEIDAKEAESNISGIGLSCLNLLSIVDRLLRKKM